MNVPSIYFYLHTPISIDMRWSWRNFSVIHNSQKQVPIKHNVTHHITTTGPPVHARARRFSLECLHIARKEVNGMLQSGIIRPSTSEWASPWSLKSQEVGAFVGITMPLTTPQLLTDILYPTFRNLQLIYMVPPFTTNLTWLEHITKYQLRKQTFPIQQLSLHLASLNFYTYHSDWETWCRLKTFRRFIDQVLRDLPFCYAYLQYVK